MDSDSSAAGSLLGSSRTAELPLRRLMEEVWANGLRKGRTFRVKLAEIHENFRVLRTLRHLTPWCLFRHFNDSYAHFVLLSVANHAP